MKEKAFSLIEQRDSSGWSAYRRANPKNIDLENLKFVNLSIDSFDLSECDLNRSEFTNCSLVGVNFSHSYFKDCKFDNCDLRGADFTNCDFGYTRFYRCELYSVDFSGSSGLYNQDIKESFGDDTTKLPKTIEIPDHWVSEDFDFEIEEENADKYIKLNNKEFRLPKIPDRVVAPVETVWSNNFLLIANPTGEKNLSPRVTQKLLQAFEKDLTLFLAELESTNVDSRVMESIRRFLADLSGGKSTFDEDFLLYWYKIRPILEYARLTRGEHSEYVEARFISIEQNFREILSTFEDWREFEAAAETIKIRENFDNRLFLGHQKEFSKELKRHPDSIDSRVPMRIDDIIDLQSYSQYSGKSKGVIFGAASSIANILSKIFKAAVDEIINYIKDGAKFALKSLIASMMAAGGSALLWFIGVGLDAYPWLRHAWDFIRKIYNIN